MCQPPVTWITGAADGDRLALGDKEALGLRLGDSDDDALCEGDRDALAE